MDVKKKTVIWVAAILYAVVLVKLLIHVDRYFIKPYGSYADFESKRVQSFQVRIRNYGQTTPRLLPIATTVVNMSRITDTTNMTNDTCTSIFGNNMTAEEQIIAKNGSLHFELDDCRSKGEISNYYLSFRKGFSETDIVIFVLSKWSHFRQRETIRKTWGNELVANSTLNAQIALLFITGKGDPEFQHHVVKEFQEHEDILIGEFPEDEHKDRSKSDVLKFLLGVDLIVGHHTSNPVVVVAFDDFYINLSLLLQNLQSVLLNTTLQDKFWIGTVRKGKTPIRDRKSRWFLAAKDYPSSNLPTFCSMETGFVLTFGAAKDLHARFIAQHYAILPLMDVFIGVAARDGNWSIRQDESVIPIWPKSEDICSVKHQTITTGFYSPQLLSTAHTTRYNSTFYMSKQIQRLCFDPDLNALLPSNVSSINLIQGVLSYATNPENTCRSGGGRSNQEVFMIMLISSKPEHFDRRLVIRKTYGKETIIQNKHVRLLFVLGLSQTETINTNVQNEATIYKDMIIFDFQESHLHLTLKVIGGLKWVTEHCQKAKFMYKGTMTCLLTLTLSLLI
ncbi:beta-1,3-galactosyltransferase 2-like [Amphiura filiformis]|uniref:beta-1,3-galactosyltransferase 2-like n=1 Tax=Amphiura filiformis TaxID=82378 RepID=UPI003B2252BA